MYHDVTVSWNVLYEWVLTTRLEDDPLLFLIRFATLICPGIACLVHGTTSTTACTIACWPSTVSGLEENYAIKSGYIGFQGNLNCLFNLWYDCSLANPIGSLGNTKNLGSSGTQTHKLMQLSNWGYSAFTWPPLPLHHSAWMHVCQASKSQDWPFKKWLD